MDRLASDGLSSNRPKRSRHDSLTCRTTNQEPQLLVIEDVLSVISAQATYDGGVNCQVCGKLYKSKVCFVKHIWEHSVYWSIFEGVKNQDRVLSIQAAIILCYAFRGGNFTESNPDLDSLLVTYPNVPEKRMKRDIPDLMCDDSDVSSDADDSIQNVTDNDIDDVEVSYQMLNLNSKPGKRTTKLNRPEKRKYKAYLNFVDSTQISKLHFSSAKSRSVTGQLPNQYLNDMGLSHPEGGSADNFVSPVKRKRGD